MILKRTYESPLYSNKFITILLKENTNIYDNHPKKSKQSQIEYMNNLFDKLNDKEKYVLKISNIVFNITNIFDEIEQIPIYFKYFPRYKTYENNGITKDDYLKYHLKNYVIRINTILDQLALLISEVYSLGLSPRRCSVEKVLENNNTKNTVAAKALKEFKQSIQNIKKIRNEIVHEGSFYDKDIQLLGSYIFINEQNDIEIIPDDEIKELHKHIIDEKSKQFEKNNEVVLLMILKIMISLVEPLSIRLKTG